MAVGGVICAVGGLPFRHVQAPGAPKRLIPLGSRAVLNVAAAFSTH